MMQQQTLCPNCGAPLTVDHAGTMKCDYCGKRLKVRPSMTPPQPMAPMPPPQVPTGLPQPMPVPQPVPTYTVTAAGPNKAAIIIPIAIALVATLGGIVPAIMMAGGGSSGGYSSGFGSGGGPAGPTQPVSLGETKMGNLSGPNITYQDYTLNVQKAVKVRIDMVGQGIDSHVDLMAAGGAVIGTDDDGGSGLNSRLEQALQPGQYTVRAKLHSDHGSGSYALSVAGLGLGSGLTRPVTVPGAVSTVLGPPSSRTLGPGGAFFDEYSFPVIAGQAVRVAVRCDGCHLTLVIEDQFGNVVTGDPSRGQFRAIDAMLTGAAPGTYVARIASREHSPWTGQYVLMVTDAVAQAGGGSTSTLAPGLVVFGNLERGRRRPTVEYQLQVPPATASAPGMYTIFLDTNGSSILAARARLEVLDAAGTTIAQGNRMHQALVATAMLTPGQAYRVRITGTSRLAEGPYTLAVARPIP